MVQASAPIDKSLFEEVWQYGSDETEMSTKPWGLDGIAPQCEVTGLSDNRIYIDKDDPNRDFLKAHYGSSYEWIFDRTSQQSGYVKPR